MADFDQLLSALKQGAAQLAAHSLQDFRKAAVKDAHAFLEQTRADLERWVHELEAGTLTKDDFEFLVKGKQDLAEMQALKQAGLALVRVDQFRNSLLNLVIGTAVKMFPRSIA
jgi:hypothetical protein